MRPYQILGAPAFPVGGEKLRTSVGACGTWNFIWRPYTTVDFSAGLEELYVAVRVRIGPKSHVPRDLIISLTKFRRCVCTDM